MNYLLINDQLDVLKADLKTCRKEHLTRLLEQCRSYEDEVLSTEHPHTSITYIGMAAANLSLAYLLTEQDHYLQEAKRWIFTAVDYDVWGYGFLVDVDLSASWLLYGLGLSYDWLKDHLTDEERSKFLNKLILQGNKIFDYGQDNLGHCWSTNYWQNHNWINYSGLLTTAYAIRSEHSGAQVWIDEIKDNFEKVFEYLPEDGSNYEGTGYWRYAINFFLSAADYIREDGGPNYFEAGFLKNSFDYRIYQSAPNWEENINFADVHDRRSSHSISAYYKIASEYNNEQAQWLGEMVRTKFLFREAYQSKIFPGILPEAFLELIWFNPKIEQKSPQSLPLTKYFPDLGLVVMRSSWDTDATHLSFKSSPAGGHKQWELSWKLDKENDWKTRSLTHYHVDFNHFILIHNGASLAIDEGYNRTSKAEVHNLITVDGTGCVGEKIWEEGDLSDPQLFDLNCKGIHNVWRDVPEEAIAKIEAFSNDNGYTYVVGESSKMYYPEMKLTRNARHIINSECGYFIFLDELESELEHIYTWRMHSERYANQVSQDQFEIINGAGALNVFTVFPQIRLTNVDETLVEEIMTPQRPDDIRRISLKTLLIENPEKNKNSYFLNVLQPKDAIQSDSSSEILAKPIKGDSFIGVEVTSNDHIETFIFSNENKIAYKDIQSKSKWVSILKDKAGNVVKTTYYDGVC
ncbi:DUF4962 domain-containing protein [Pseudoalteromonas sp. SWXJZ94C]|uniref:DUF4962 domain-containing protein n=1 Tax=Pseudoalteromonas sp. SWXJZ94C TaxID=2792065 RepID=UPI0018CDCE05|nr:DUF4962 domain-containing protein [Pseudoalteromonas sp. SWXJZ94C]MBH0057903.1 DUF4962 domain-containing protein [Pseudoalteromonas sp. SWXJZ94C]